MKSLRNFAIAGAVAGAALGGAAFGATMLTPAGAQSATTTAPAASTPAPSTQAAPSAPSTGGATTPPPAGHDRGGPPSGPHQANGKTEAPLTGDDLAKVTAATEAKVPGATIDRAETDADGDAFEAHITKSDGSKATVKFDASFNVTNVVDGMG